MEKLKTLKLEPGERTQWLFSEDWFEGSGKREVYARFYSMPFRANADFYIPGIHREVIEYCGVPFRMIVMNIAEQNYTTDIPWLVHSQHDQHQIAVERLNRVLPHTDYVVVTTPIKANEQNAYDNASLRMDGFVATIRLIGGNNLLRELVREAAIDISTANMRTQSKIAPVPLEAEGPFTTADIWEQHKELISAIGDAGSSERGRFALATQLLERAFLSPGPLRFFSYWVALEVAADTHSTRKIITILAKAYGATNSYIQNNLGFDHLIRTRTAVFHSGEIYELPGDVERYLQCVFLDVLTSKLGLDCKRNCAAMVEAGFDLNRLDRTIGQATTWTIEL